ncbi:MAG: tRNA (adenosine(37)-N6)-threonylcarbamoyltransferase complex transferase subunit TsaD [Clostridia bacterium]|nr:tRNA (adenosine(37)-N6)-threonylcarbamoyltransferase complex transferase subunit TsaD [Clostridia bacterium]
MMDKTSLTVLAIESSCDETACAIVRDGVVLGECISSQVPIHRLYGGVVPEIASRNHAVNINTVVADALAQAEVTSDDIDAVAVTYGAGLIGALLTGVSYAKGLAYAWGKPLVAVNHIRGHIAANYLAHPDLKPPYVALIVSGGHTAVAVVEDYTTLRVVGQTADDAVGEAFDKVARVLSLPYPGGPEIEKLARGGKAVIPMPRAKMDGYDFSYSGLKTAVINYVHTHEQKGEAYDPADVAASFQDAAVGVLADHAVAVAQENGLDAIAVAGGVGANGRLREVLNNKAYPLGIKAYFPPKRFCTDNASMIGMEAIVQIRSGAPFAPDTLDARATIPLVERK